MTWNRAAILAAVPVAAVAVIAGVVSYSHIEALGLATGQSITDARLLPLAVDGLIVAGSVILLAGSWLGWIGVALGVAGTLYANVMSGLPRGPLAATVAAWPALSWPTCSPDLIALMPGTPPGLDISGEELGRSVRVAVQLGGYAGYAFRIADPRITDL